MPAAQTTFARDYRRSQLKHFDPLRDTAAQCILDLNADSVTGVADGGTVEVWRDESGWGHAVTQDVASSRPLLNLGDLNGHNYLNFRSGKYMTSASGAFGVWPVDLIQPITVFAVVRCLSSSSGGRRITASTGDMFDLVIESQHTLACRADNSVFTRGGDRLDDDEWHVLCGVFDTSCGATFVDGRLMHADTTQAHGANPWVGLAIGARPDGSESLSGDIARIVAFQGRLTHSEIQAFSTRLGRLYGVETADAHPGVVVVDSTAGGTYNGSIRYWLPGDGSSPTALIIYSHQAGAGSSGHQVSTTFATYPAIHEFLREGWAVVAPLAYSSSSSDNWGATRGMQHTLDAYNFMKNKCPNIARVGMVGVSMGGLISSLAVAGVDVTIPNVKGVAMIDAVWDLASMYANATYTSSIRTAYGIAVDGSDYAARTSGHDPALRAISDFTGVRWRFYGDDADTTVPPATHGQSASSALLAADPPAAEAAYNEHEAGHVNVRSTWPIDLVDFFNRCFA